MFGNTFTGKPGLVVSFLMMAVVSISCGRDSVSDVEVSPALEAFDSQLAKREIDMSRALASVNGVPIYREDLELYLKDNPVAETTAQVLEGVIRSELLAQEARRRGYARDKDVVAEFKKALALELLVQKGRGFSEKSIAEATLKAAYDRQKRARFVHGEMRTVVHALVSPEKGKGISNEDRKIAAQIQKKVQHVESEREFRTIVGDLKGEFPSASIIVEKLPPFDSESKAFVEPFVKGAFKIAYPEQRVSSPVETRFGVHVIFVESQSDSSDVPFSEARQILAGEMVDDERRKYIASFLDTVEKKADIFVYDEVLAESSGKGIGE